MGDLSSRSAKKARTIWLLSCISALFLICITISLAIFRDDKSLASQLDIAPIILSGPVVKTFNAELNKDSLDDGLLVNDVVFSVETSPDNPLYVRCSFMVDSNDVDTAASMQFQNTYIPTENPGKEWVLYEDYYYLFMGGRPAELTDINSNTITFLDEDSIYPASFLIESFFNYNYCKVKIIVEAVDANLLPGAETAAQVKSISSTPLTPQTHIVNFYDTEGSVVSSISGVVHGSSVLESVPNFNLLAIPESHEFSSWNTQVEGLGATIGNSVLSNITRDINLYPIVDIKHFTISVVQSLYGEITPSTTEVEYGSNLNIYFIAEQGYEIKSAIIDGESVGAVESYLFKNIISDHTVTGEFGVKYYSVIVTYNGNGSVSPLFQQVTYGQNAEPITISPNVGTFVSSFTINGVEQGGSTLNSSIIHTISNITQNITVNVEFSNGVFSIFVTQISNCSITESISDIPMGESRTVTATPLLIPAPGYRLKKLVVDGVEIDAQNINGEPESYTFENITADHTFSAIVERHVFIVTASIAVQSTGTVTPTSSEVNPNESIDLTLSPNAGFELEKIVDDGNVVSTTASQTTYTVSNVTANRNVVVHYKKMTKNINVSASANGQITQTSVGTTSVVGPATNSLLVNAEYNSTINAIIMPNVGYKISAISLRDVDMATTHNIDISSLTAGDSFSITFSPSVTFKFTTNYLISVSFIQHIFSITVNSTTENVDGTLEQSTIGGNITGQGSYEFGSAITLTVNPSSGFEFVGYYDEQNCETPITLPETMGNENIIIYALFTRISYLLSVVEIYEDVDTTNYIVGNYGGVGPGDQYFKYGQSISLSTPVARTGFSLVGGYFSDASGTNITSVPVNMPSQAVILYAKFSRLTSVLTINPNGGTYNGSTLPLQIEGKYEKVYSATPTPEKTGYTFVDYTLTPTTSGVVDGTLNGTTYTFGIVDATLNSNYVINQYTLAINPNGGSYAGQYVNVSVTQDYGTSYTLFSSSFNAVTNPVNYLNPPDDTYIFDGWSKTSGEGVLEIIGGQYVFTFEDGNANVSASWLGITYELSIVEYYEKLDGSFIEGTVGGTVTGDGQLTPNSAIVDTKNPAQGFSFAGYYLDSLLTTEATMPSIITSSGQVYYAKFTRNTYNISFQVESENVNGTFSSGTPVVNESTTTISTSGGSITFNSSPIKFGAAIGLSTSSLAGFGLLENKVYPNSSYISNTGISASSLTSMPANDLSYYVRFVRNLYTLTINPNGGIYNGTTNTSDITQKYGSSYTILEASWSPAPEKYFTGWTKSEVYGTVVGSTYTFGLGDETWTANWEYHEYGLTINPNGGNYNGSTNNTILTGHYGDVLNLLTPTRTGYSISGWTMSGYGRIASPFDGYYQFVYGNGDAIITASWIPNYYDINVYEYYINTSLVLTAGTAGGTVSGGQFHVAHGTSITLTATAKTGFTFSGYFSNAACTTILNAASPWVFEATTTINVYAKFTSNSYNLTINPNGGAYNGSTTNTVVNKAYDVSYVLLPVTKTGYSLVGWSLDGAGTIRYDNASGNYVYTYGNGVATLTAQWSINKYTITVLPYYQTGTSTFVPGTIGGSVGFSPATLVNISHGTDVTLTAYAVDGYEFAGFFTNSALTQAARSGDNNITTWTFDVSQTITIYAKFKFFSLDITQNHNDETGETTVVSGLNKDSVISTAFNNVITRENYVFLGWSTSEEAGGSIVGNLLPQITENSRFNIGSVNYSTGLVTMGGTGFYTNFIAVENGKSYSLLNYGSVSALSWIIYDEGREYVGATSNIDTYTATGDGFIRLFYDAASYANKNSIVLSQSSTIQSTYSNLFGNTSTTVYAKWRIAKNYIYVKSVTKTIYNIASYSTSGGTVKQNDINYSGNKILVEQGTQPVFTLNSSASYFAAAVNICDKTSFDLLTGYQPSSTRRLANYINGLSDFTPLYMENNGFNVMQTKSGANYQYTLPETYVAVREKSIVLIVYFEPPVVLDINGGSGSQPSASISSDYTSFSIGYNTTPVAPTSGAYFYYYDTTGTSSAMGQNGMRYDVGVNNNIATYSISPEDTTEALHLYAIYLTPTSSYLSEYAVIPLSVTTMSSYQSLGSSKITKYITLPPIFTTLSESAFFNENSLLGVSFPVNTITAIPNYTFYNCTSVNNLYLPDTIITISNYAFYKTTSLSSIHIPQNLQTIDVSAFSFTAITSLTLPDSTTTINSYAFSSSQLTEIYLGKYISTAGLSVRAFNGATHLENIECSSENEVLYSSGGILYVNDADPSSNYELDSIFRVPEGMNRTSFSGGGTSKIQACYDYCFYGNENLRSLSWTGTVSFGNYGFSNCVNLDNIEMLSFLAFTFGDNCFRNCKKIVEFKSVSFLAHISGNYCFSGCSSLTSLSIVGGMIQAWGTGMLNGCSELSYINTGELGTYTSESGLPVGPTSYAISSFSSASPWRFSTDEDASISNWTVVTNVTVTGYYTCNSPDLNNWQLAQLGDETYKIVSYKGNNDWTDASNPLIVPSILKGNGNTYNITILESFYGTNTTSRTINYFEVSQGITTIGTSASSSSIMSDYASDLISFALPSSASTINSNAFNGCSQLTSCELPNVTTINSGAFNNCGLLTSVSFNHSNNMSVANNAFSGTTSALIVYIPNVSNFNRYQSSLGGKGFAQYASMYASGSKIAEYRNNQWVLTQKYRFFIHDHYIEQNQYSVTITPVNSGSSRLIYAATGDSYGNSLYELDVGRYTISTTFNYLTHSYIPDWVALCKGQRVAAGEDIWGYNDGLSYFERTYDWVWNNNQAMLDINGNLAYINPWDHRPMPTPVSFSLTVSWTIDVTSDIVLMFNGHNSGSWNSTQDGCGIRFYPGFPNV